MSEEPGKYDLPGAPDAAKAQDHENRARAVADSLRRYLVGLHTGGIALVVWFAAQAMSSHTLLINRAMESIAGVVVAFTLGLVATGLSIQIAKHRELRRRVTALAGDPDPRWSWYLQSWAWEWLSLALFAAGVLCALAHWC